MKLGFRDRMAVAAGDLLFRITNNAAGARVAGQDHLSMALGEAPGIILSGWHGRLLVGAQLRAGRDAAVMVSRHRDGEIIARIIEKHGFRAVRGSTTRGGSEALKEMIELAGRGVRELEFTPDGPRGPRHVAQPGVIHLARRTGYWIIPAGVSARPGTFLDSWDRFLVPWPWSRFGAVYGPPVRVPADPGEGDLDALRGRLETSMIDVERQADRLVGWAA